MEGRPLSGRGVRCPQCGARVPADATGCRVCGHALDDDQLALYDGASGAGGEGWSEAVSAPARAGGRRPVKVLGLAVLVVAVGVAALLSAGDDRAPTARKEASPSTATTEGGATTPTSPVSRPRPVVADDVPTTVVPNPVLAEAAGTALLLIGGPGGGPVVVVDLATGIRVELPGIEMSNSFDPSLFESFTETAVVGGMAVLFNGSTATAVPLDGSGEPVPLGEADMAFGFPDDGLVLLVRSTQERVTATGVDVTGRVVAPPAFELPGGALPVAVTSLGLLVGGPDGGTFLVDPRSGAVERLPVGRVIAAAGTMVVHELCDDQLVCTIHRTDLTSGADLVVPVDVPLFPVGVSLSPDGRWLAVFSSSDAGARLHLIDTATGQARELSARPLFWLGAAGRWSPSGDWLFVVGERELHTSSDVLVAVRADDGQVVRTAVETAAVLAAAPSPFPPLAAGSVSTANGS